MCVCVCVSQNPVKYIYIYVFYRILRYKAKFIPRDKCLSNNLKKPSFLVLE